MVNGPVFGAPTGKAFLNNLRLLAGTTDKAEGAKKMLSTLLQGVESLVEAFGGKSATLIQIGGHPETTRSARPSSPRRQSSIAMTSPNRVCSQSRPN